MVAVRGRVERIVGAAVLTAHALEDGLTTRRLRLRIDEPPERRAVLERALLLGALDRARATGTERIVFADMLDAGSGLALALRDFGFEEISARDFYEFPAPPLAERLERIHARLRASGLIPAEAELTPLQPGALPRVREFIERHLPGNAVMLAASRSGYRPEHSLALWLRGELKGVLLSSRAGRSTRVGLRLVAPELRGGIGWANLLLMYVSVRGAVRMGLETISFELNPEIHEDTQQLARMQGASFTGRKSLLALRKVKACSGM